MESKSLPPFETRETISSEACILRYENEEKEARDAVKKAVSVSASDMWLYGVDPNGLGFLSPATQSEHKVLDAHAKFKNAKCNLERITERNHLVSTFRKTEKLYKLAAKEIPRNEALAKWVHKQIPLVNAECEREIKVELKGKGKREAEKNALK